MLPEISYGPSVSCCNEKKCLKYRLRMLQVCNILSLTVLLTEIPYTAILKKALVLL